MTEKKEVLVATANRGKAMEIKEIFSGSGFEPKFLFDFLEKLGNINIVENAKSFEGNALIKAIVMGEASGMITLADDSGLCVDALGGNPGVYSARYSEEKTDIANCQKLLSVMEGISDDKRSCHYNCTVAIYDPKTKFVETVSGIWEGRVAHEFKGDKSFGYAPIFLAKEFNYKKTNAEFDHDKLVGINHRGKAFRQAIEILKLYFSGEKNTYQIVEADVDDISGIFSVQKETWLDTYPNEQFGIRRNDVLEKDFDSQERFDKWRSSFENPDDFFKTWVVKDIEGKVIGFCIAEQGKIGRIRAIYILPSCQKRGLGKDLMETALSWLGDCDVVLSVASYNLSAISFYEKFGFRLVRDMRPDESCILPSGKIIPELEMIRRV